MDGRGNDLLEGLKIAEGHKSHVNAFMAFTFWPCQQQLQHLKNKHTPSWFLCTMYVYFSAVLCFN